RFSLKCLTAESASPQGPQRGSAEDVSDELAEHQVQDRDEEHHEQDETQHHQGVIDQLLPRRSDDLLEFCHNLAEELQDSSEESELLGTGGTAGCAASLLCRCVAHTSSLGRSVSLGLHNCSCQSRTAPSR